MADKQPPPSKDAGKDANPTRTEKGASARLEEAIKTFRNLRTHLITMMNEANALLLQPEVDKKKLVNFPGQLTAKYEEAEKAVDIVRKLSVVPEETLKALDSLKTSCNTIQMRIISATAEPEPVKSTRSSSHRSRKSNVSSTKGNIAALQSKLRDERLRRKYEEQQEEAERLLKQKVKQ